jgi:hypothetical protein
MSHLKCCALMVCVCVCVWREGVGAFDQSKKNDLKNRSTGVRGLHCSVVHGLLQSGLHVLLASLFAFIYPQARSQICSI